MLLSLGLAGGLALSPLSLPPLLLGYALAVASAIGLRRDGAPSMPAAAPRHHAALAALGACDPLRLAVDRDPWRYQALIWVGSLACLALLWRQAVRAGDRRSVAGRGSGGALWALLGVKLVLLAAAPLLVPRPPIDVWQLHQVAADHLLHGRNPYTTAVPDIYGGRAPFGHQALYPYPPLNLLLSLPAYLLLGDYRYGLVAALALAVLLLRRAARERGVPGSTVDLVTLALVLHPRLERLIVHGWTEPYLVLALAGFLYLRGRAPGGVGEVLCLLSLPLLKQYFAVPVVLYLVLLRPRRRSLLLAGGVALALSAPLLLWNFRATVQQGLLFFIARVWFRPDSISLVAALHPLLGWTSSAGTALLAQAVSGAAAGWLLRRRGDGGLLLAAAISLWTSFLFGPQAFVNYYFFVGVVVLAALLALATPAPAEQQAANAAAAAGRAIALGASAALLLGLAVAVADFIGCPGRADRQQAKLDRGAAILDDGGQLAVAGEAVFLCQSRDCLGPAAGPLALARCHDDLRCVCAAASATPAEVAARLAVAGAAPARCLLDEAHPGPDDAFGACRRGRCHLVAPDPPATAAFPMAAPVPPSPAAPGTR